MTWIITSDLHLTDRPEHHYRLEFLDWLEEEVTREGHSDVFILGDISDAKDRHSARLVNAVADSIYNLASVATVHILYGNHDGPSQDRPFWAFLGGLGGKCGVNYYIEADLSVIGVPSRKGGGNPSYGVLFSPWGAENKAIEILNQKPDLVKYVFMHATVNGARSENGTVMEGSCPSRFAPKGWEGKVYSGDIHLPQIVGDVEYVGAPYHVHYGDPFEGRVIVLDPSSSKATDIHPPGSPRLHSLDLNVDNPVFPDRIKPGDRVKINAEATRVLLPADWQTYVKTMRDKATSLGIELTTATLTKTSTTRSAAPSPRRSDESIVRTYAERQKFSAGAIAIGVELVK